MGRILDFRRVSLLGLAALLIGFAACGPDTRRQFQDLQDRCNQGIQSACDELGRKCDEIIPDFEPKKEDDKNQTPRNDIEGVLLGEEEEVGYSLQQIAVLAGLESADSESSQLNSGEISSGTAGAAKAGTTAGVSKEDACAICAICAAYGESERCDSCSAGQSSN